MNNALRFSHVSYGDELSVIKMVSMEELEEIRSYASERRWGATWTSAEALIGQVHAKTPKFLLPVFRNAAGDTEIQSLRCHIWVLLASETRLSMASLVDVAVSRFRELRSLEPEKAIPVLKRMLDCHPRSKLD